MDNPWNIPDWRKREEYPDHKTFPLHLWRWEFVRRSAEYRADWQRHSEHCQTPSSRRRHGCGAYGPYVLRKYGLYEPISPMCRSPEDTPGGFLEHENYITQTSFCAAQVKHNAFAAGTLFPDAPDENPRRDLGVYGNSLESFEWRAMARARILVSIDPRQPLEPQFKQIKKQIGKAPSRTRARTSHYELALRLLDARSTDRGQIADWRDIQKVISMERHRGTLMVRGLKRKHRDAEELQKTFWQPYYEGAGSCRHIDDSRSAEPAPNRPTTLRRTR